MKNLKKVFAIAGSIIAVAVIAVLIVLFAKKGPSKVAIDKTTPQTYLNGVLKNGLSETSKEFSDQFAKVFKDVDFKNFKTTSNIKLNFTPTFYSIVNPMAGIELDSVKSIGLTTSVERKKDASGLLYRLGLNDVELATVDVRLNNNKMYIEAPGVLTKGFILNDAAKQGLDLGTFTKMYDLVDFYMELLGSTGSRYLSTATKYVDILVNADSKVTFINDKYGQTAFDWTLDGQTMKNFLIEFLSDVKKDKKLLKDVQEALEVLEKFAGSKLADYNNEEMVQNIDGIIEEVKEIDASEIPDCLYTISINSEDKVTGMSFVFEDLISGNFYLIPEKNIFSCNLSVYLDGDSISVNGNGKTSDTIFDGEFVVSYDGKDIMTFGFEGFDFEKNTGKIVLGNFNPEMDAVFPYFSVMKMVFDVKSASIKQSQADILVTIADKEFITGNYTTDISKSDGINIPTKDVEIIEDVNSLSQNFMNYIDLTALMDNLQKTGCADLIAQLFGGMF